MDSPLKLGVAPDSWGIWFRDDELQMPWERCLDEIQESGYEWIELGPYGYLPTVPSQLRQELDKRGLRVSGTFVMGQLDSADYWPTLEAEVIGVCQLLAELGAGHLIVIDDPYNDLITGEMLRSPKVDDAGWNALIETTHRIARIASERFGLRAVFHPHAETHVEYEHQIERFLADADPRLVGLCLDTGHHEYRGGDAVEFARAHADRVEYFHLKSVDTEVRDQVERGRIPFAGAVEAGVFCEPDRGSVDFVALAALLAEIDFSGYAIVEQDMYPAPAHKPLPIARRTYRYLRALGF